jgi:mevalonate kinase
LTSLHVAVGENHTTLLPLLLEKATDINIKNKVSGGGGGGEAVELRGRGFTEEGEKEHHPLEYIFDTP